MAETESKLGALKTRVMDWLGNQEWYQEGKGKWEALDPQNRMIVQIGGGSVIVLMAALYVGLSGYEVYSLRKEITDREELASTIQSAQEEIRRLKSTSGVQLVPAEGSWKPYLDGLAGQAGLDPTVYTLTTEKNLKASEASQESLVTLDMQKVNLRQLVQFAIELENGSRPIKLTQLRVDTQEDMSGWLNASLSFSAYSAPKGP